MPAPPDDVPEGYWVPGTLSNEPAHAGNRRECTPRLGLGPAGAPKGSATAKQYTRFAETAAAREGDALGTPLIINPVAGKGAGRALAEALVDRLSAYGVTTETHFTQERGHAEALVAEAAAAHTSVIVAGGDGTVCEAVNGAMRAERPPAIGLLPLGTGNDFAKMLGLDHDWQAACRRVADGRTRSVDIGCCNGRYFANGVGIGFDAQVAAEASRVRYLRGNAVYFLALARTLALRYATPHVRIEHDGGTLNHRVTLVAAANGRWYGGAFRIAPDAEIDDGYLELVVARGLGRLGILRLVPRVLRGTHVRDPAVEVMRTRRATVISDVPLPAHVDGESLPGETLRLEIEILPRALSFIA